MENKKNYFKRKLQMKQKKWDFKNYPLTCGRCLPFVRAPTSFCLFAPLSDAILSLNYLLAVSIHIATSRNR